MYSRGAKHRAGEGRGEGFPLPAEEGGGNRAAIHATFPWRKRLATRRLQRFRSLTPRSASSTES